MAELFGPRGAYTRPSPSLFGPRTAFTRPGSLSRARRLVGAEKRSRIGAGPWGTRTPSQIGEAVTNWPPGQAAAYGGRSVPEVRRDVFLNRLRGARGAEPIAPAYRPTFTQRMQTWGRGVSRRVEERGGYR